MLTNTMGVDQHGETYHALGKHPRKELLSRLACRHASKMYVDKPDGTPKHIGYIVAGRWIRLFTVQPWEQDAQGCAK